MKWKIKRVTKRSPKVYTEIWQDWNFWTPRNNTVHSLLQFGSFSIRNKPGPKVAQGSKISLMRDKIACQCLFQEIVIIKFQYLQKQRKYPRRWIRFCISCYAVIRVLFFIAFLCRWFSSRAWKTELGQK